MVVSALLSATAWELHEPLTHAPFVFPAASGGRENLDRHWLVSDRAGVNRPATGCALARHLEHLENRGTALCVLAYPPEGATCAYLGPDGKLTTRRAPLDIAVREPKNQDRRVGHAKTVPGPADDGLLRFPCINRLNVDDRDELLRDPSNQPEHAPTAHRVADRRKGASGDGEVVLEVTAGETDHEGLSGHRTPPLPSGAFDVPVSLRRETAALRESASEEGHRQEPGPDRRRRGPPRKLLRYRTSWYPPARRHKRSGSRVARQLAGTTSDRVIPVCVLVGVCLDVGWRRARLARALPRCRCVPGSRFSVCGLLSALEVARLATFAGVVVGAVHRVNHGALCSPPHWGRNSAPVERPRRAPHFRPQASKMIHRTSSSGTRIPASILGRSCVRTTRTGWRVSAISGEGLSWPGRSAASLLPLTPGDAIG